jgi:sulfur transfer complex TusBCD TusB component (DsrH family)
MTWHYYGDPAASTVDAVRALIGQCSSGDAVLLLDEEITWAVAQNAASVQFGAAACADMLAARYSVKAQQLNVGQTSVSYGSRAKEFTAMAKQFRQQALLAGVSPWAGGTSKSDVTTREDDTDRVQPWAKLEIHDNPLTDTTT